MCSTEVRLCFWLAVFGISRAIDKVIGFGGIYMSNTSLIRCTVKDVVWLSSSVFKISFDPDEKFKYRSGQFVSVAIPTYRETPKFEWRCYSLATSYENAYKKGYEIYVRFVQGGLASEYLSFLRKGDTMTISAPQGDFHYVPPSKERDVVFIATNSGIAPIKAILESEEFKKNKPKRTFLLLGTRTEEESLFVSYFEKMGINVIPAVTKPKILTFGFWGRVTEFLERGTFPWDAKKADYYVVGSDKMVRRVLYQLNLLQNVDLRSIFVDNFRSALGGSPSSTADLFELADEKKAA